jgi:predicted nucleotidyltransferase
MDLSDAQRDVVVSAIRQFLPPEVEIFFFGSRVEGTARRGSDLDVLLKGQAPIALDSMALIRERLEESDLPFKVDLLDYHACSPQMLKNIKGSMAKV